MTIQSHLSGRGWGKKIGKGDTHAFHGYSCYQITLFGGDACVEGHSVFLVLTIFIAVFGRWGKIGMPPCCSGACSREGGARERGREVRKANNSSPATTVNLGLLVLSVVQKTGWHQGAQRDKCCLEGHYIQSLC